jgi:hypothetical protein
LSQQLGLRDVSLLETTKEATMGKGILLWLAGVPLSVIILIAIFTNWI